MTCAGKSFRGVVRGNRQLSMVNGQWIASAEADGYRLPLTSYISPITSYFPRASISPI